MAGQIWPVRLERRTMFSISDLLSYDPALIRPAQREQMANLLRIRGEYLAKVAEVTALRAQSWTGVEGAKDAADLKALELAVPRLAYVNAIRALFKDAVDTDGLVDLLPMFGIAILQKFKVPPALLLEAVGMDIDQIKLFVEAVKEGLSDL